MKRCTREPCPPVKHSREPVRSVQGIDGLDTDFGVKHHTQYAESGGGGSCGRGFGQYPSRSLGTSSLWAGLRPVSVTDSGAMRRRRNGTRAGRFDPGVYLSALGTHHRARRASPAGQCSPQACSRGPRARHIRILCLTTHLGLHDTVFAVPPLSAPLGQLAADRTGSGTQQDLMMNGAVALRATTRALS